MIFAIAANSLIHKRKLCIFLQIIAQKSKRKKKKYHQKNIKVAVGKAGIGPIAEDMLAEGDVDTALLVMWRLIEKFRIAPCLKYWDRDTTAERALLSWCKLKTKGYAHCGGELTDFHRSWMTGLPFVALLHWREPERIHFDPTLTPEEACESAFALAEKIGVPRILEVSDICDRTVAPDKQVVLTYVSEIYHVLNKADLQHQLKKI